MGRTVLLLGVAALALAACSKKADQTASAPAAGEAAKPAAAGPFGGGEPPTRKPGLWEQTLSSERVHQTIRMCIDAATEEKAKWWRTEGARQARNDSGIDCTEQNISRTLTGGWKIHSVCKIEGTTTTTDGSATGDFGNSYHVELTSTTSGSPMPEANGTHKMSMDGVWKGPCPAGWSGGDMEMPGGMRINLLNPQAGPMVPGMKPGERPSRAQLEAMRAQAEAMEKQMKSQAK